MEKEMAGFVEKVKKKRGMFMLEAVSY